MPIVPMNLTALIVGAEPAILYSPERKFTLNEKLDNGLRMTCRILRKLLDF
jgi:hypothetical protein